MDVNVKAILNVSQVVAKKMIAKKIKGSIVNISSQTSKVGTVRPISRGHLEVGCRWLRKLDFFLLLINFFPSEHCAKFRKPNIMADQDLITVL